MESVVSKIKVESFWGRHLTPTSDLHMCAYHVYIHSHKCAHTHTHKHVLIHITYPKFQEFFCAMLEAKSQEERWQQGHIFSESYGKGFFLPALTWCIPWLSWLMTSLCPLPPLSCAKMDHGCQLYLELTKFQTSGHTCERCFYVGSFEVGGPPWIWILWGQKTPQYLIHNSCWQPM